jgi:arylformamidase
MSDKDGAWHDGMYNNRALVPDFAKHLARWAETSADALRSHPRQVDVRYGGGPKEHLDIFPSQADHAPVLVYIHGGYWRGLDKKDFSFVGPAFSRKACVVIPNYALCPAVTVPDISMQMVRALAWTWRHIAQYGGNRDRIVVVGHSAGGQLAAMMLSCLWPVSGRDLPRDLVKAALAISALNDLDAIMKTPHLQADLRLTRAQVLKASPARLPAPRQGELHAVVGGDESAEFLRQNQLIRQAWGAERVPVCETLPGLNHFSVVDALVEPGHRLNGLAHALLDRPWTPAT